MTFYPVAPPTNIGPVLVTGTPVAGSLTAATSGTAAKWSAAPVTAKPANPAATASATLVMMGAGSTAAYTATASGIVYVTVTGTATTATAAVNLTLGGRFGTGTAPVNGAAVTGTRFGGAADISPTPPALGVGVPFALTDVVTLTAGQANWFDIALLTSVGADVASVANLSFSFSEL